MKKVLAIVLVLALALSMAACGTGGAGDPQHRRTQFRRGEPLGEQVTLSFWTLALTPTFTDFIQGLIDKYEAENPT